MLAVDHVKAVIFKRDTVVCVRQDLYKSRVSAHKLKVRIETISTTNIDWL